VLCNAALSYAVLREGLALRSDVVCCVVYCDGLVLCYVILCSTVLSSSLCCIVLWSRDMLNFLMSCCGVM
jgi:hypothetical protein